MKGIPGQIEETRVDIVNEIQSSQTFKQLINGLKQETKMRWVNGLLIQAMVEEIMRNHPDIKESEAMALVINQVKQELPLAEQTLRMYAMVARIYPPSLVNLVPMSFNVYMEVARLPWYLILPVLYELHDAAAAGKNVTESYAREYVDEILKELSGEVEQEESSKPVVFKLKGSAFVSDGHVKIGTPPDDADWDRVGKALVGANVTITIKVKPDTEEGLQAISTLEEILGHPEG